MLGNGNPQDEAEQETAMEVSHEKELQRCMNPKTIKALVEHDCDLSRLRPITNVFLSNDPRLASRIEHEMAVRGFAATNMCVLGRSEDEPRNSIGATIIHSVEISWIDQMTDTCIEVASDCGAEYDGWYTETD